MSERKTYLTAVVFADVSGSSRLYKKVGNEEASRRIEKIVAGLTRAVEDHHGVVVKTIGDELMSHFTRADDALAASIDFQSQGQSDLPIRVGVAWGSVLEKDQDLFGEAVNDAAAVTRIARGRQIIATEAYREQLSQTNRESLAIFDEVKLKGSQKTTRLYRVDWETHDHTAGMDRTMIGEEIGAAAQPLTLRYMKDDGTIVTIVRTPEDPPLHIGRDPRICKIVVSSPKASRDHCHISFGRGKFMLTDHSTNGTYVQSLGAPAAYLRREETPLIGRGTVGLGEPTDAGGTAVLHFET